MSIRLESYLCLLAVLGAWPQIGSAQERCPFLESSSSDGVLIAYIGNPRVTNGVTVGTVRALGLLRDGTLTESDGAFIRDGMQFWRAVEPSASPTALTRVSSFLDQMGPDHCVYHAEPADALDAFTLLSSAPLPGIFTSANDEQRAELQEHNDKCLNQFGPGNDAPCTRPELLAVSDIDGNGELEYWATEPYIWDTGITIWRRTADGLVMLMEICTACSD